MKHFSSASPGADRFAGVPASRKRLAHLGDALAYMECKVTSRLELSDHWVVYATVEMGRVSKPEV